MSVDSSWEVQRAVYAALTGDGTLMGLVQGVHDHVPAGAAFPYVTVGEATASAWGGAGLDGIEATLTLHAWSRARGHKEVKTILAALHRILHDASLAVTGQALVNLRFDFAESLLDEDGLTYHGISRFRAVTHPA